MVSKNMFKKRCASAKTQTSSQVKSPQRYIEIGALASSSTREPTIDDWYHQNFVAPPEQPQRTLALPPQNIDQWFQQNFEPLKLSTKPLVFDLSIRGRKGVSIFDLLNLECLIDGAADEIPRSEGIAATERIRCHFQLPGYPHYQGPLKRKRLSRSQAAFDIASEFVKYIREFDFSAKEVFRLQEIQVHPRSNIYIAIITQDRVHA